jgi:Na+/melibiose symporter-like transporter
MVFVPIVTVFSAISIAVLMFYDIDRSTHERNLERLEIADDAGSKVNTLEAESIPASARVS